MNKQFAYAISVFFPILVLAGLTGFRSFHLRSGQVYEIPIEAYDPRDYLAGNYLRFQTKLSGDTHCSDTEGFEPAYCFETQSLVYPNNQSTISDCRFLLRGSCRNGVFRSNLDRFYIPEEKANYLQRLLRDRQASIRVSLSASGEASIETLLFDGKDWKEYLQDQ